MKLSTRLGIIAVWPLVAIIVLALGDAPETSESIGPLLTAQRWLAGITVLYLANFVLAWRFAASWPVSMTRLLIWGLIGYICISEIVDLFGENEGLGAAIFSGRDLGDPALTASLKGQLVDWTIGLVMAVVCIGIGFENARGPAPEE